MRREFYDSDCPACGGDGVSPNIERPLPPYTGLYRPCPECRGTGKKRIPLMWQHPLLASNMDNWRKPAVECPVVRGCVIQVDRDVQVTFHCGNRLRPATDPKPATLSVTTRNENWFQASIGGASRGK